MTYAEYQNLYDEWKKCDSIKRCGEIEDVIREAALALLDRLNAVYAKYGRDFVEDDDYRTDRGFTGLVKRELPHDGKTTVHLHYSDRWKYGGECDIGISIPMKYLDDANMVELEADLRAKKIAVIERDIVDIAAEIDNLGKYKSELQKALETLKGDKEK